MSVSVGLVIRRDVYLGGAVRALHSSALRLSCDDHLADATKCQALSCPDVMSLITFYRALKNTSEHEVHIVRLEQGRKIPKYVVNGY